MILTFREYLMKTWGGLGEDGDTTPQRPINVGGEECRYLIIESFCIKGWHELEEFDLAVREYFGVKPSTTGRAYLFMFLWELCSAAGSKVRIGVMLGMDESMVIVSEELRSGGGKQGL